MKWGIVLLSTVMFFLVVCCSSSKKVLYELPVEMKENVKEVYAKQCEQGQVLYQLNCARCHSSYKGRKEIIPDFTAEQLRGYELRVTNNQHSENLTDDSCSEQDLMLIMVFLQYKKKND